METLFHDECSICLEILNINTVQLTCNHEFCFLCITNWLNKCASDNKPVRCPNCNSENCEIEIIYNKNNIYPISTPNIYTPNVIHRPTKIGFFKKIRICFSNLCK